MMRRSTALFKSAASDTFPLTAASILRSVSENGAAIPAAGNYES